MGVEITDDNFHAIVRRLVTDDRKVKRGVNMQQLPSKGDGVLIRNCFVPAPGHVFIGADLSSIEPRIQAHIMYTQYGDNSFRQIFVEERDLYVEAAISSFGYPREYCVDGAYDPTGTFKPRSLAKTGVLAKSYGQTPQAFAKKMGVSIDVAEDFFANFDRSFPSFTQMVADIRQFMRDHGYVETLFWRKRRFPDYKRVAAEAARNEERLMRLYTQRKQLRSKTVLTARDHERLDAIQADIDVLADKRGLVGYWERAAFNAVIQGTGADILKQIGNAMRAVCKQRGWEFNASIHDEIKISVPVADCTSETVELVRAIMTETATLSVPLKTDLVIETAWMREYKPDQWDFARSCPKENND